MNNSNTLRYIRRAMAWGSVTLAVSMLAFLLSTYKGLHAKYTQILSDSIGERVTARFSFEIPELDILQTARPEGLELLTSPYGGSYTTIDTSMWSEVPKLDVKGIQALPSIKHVVWQHREPEFGASPQVNFPVMRVPRGFFDVQRLSIAEGQLPSTENQVVVGQRAAQFLFGEENPIDQNIRPNSGAIPNGEIPQVASPTNDSHPNNAQTNPYDLRGY